MTAVSEALAAAGAAAMTLLDAESIAYTPATGVAVTIDALIDRRPLDGVDGMGRVPKAILRIRNDATYGRLASAIDTGGDSITWPAKKGSTTTRTSRILEILDQDAAFVTLMIG